jgi:hypothetical protein
MWPMPAQAAFPGANGKINFVRSPGGAQFMNPDGGAQTPAPVYGIWTPDAGYVLRGCNNAVCVFRADGTLDQENYYAAAINGMGWSPDGTKFVYARQGCGASYCDPENIAYQGFPSGPFAEVTAQDDLEPAWSPDGTRIAFVTFRHDPRQLVFGGSSGPNGSTELYVSNIDGTGQLRLTNSTGSEGGPMQTGIDDNDGESLPSWSPDGTKIAVASNRDGNWEIYVVNADGSGSQRLTNNPATDLRPRWSPDGTKIAFQTNRDGNQEVYSMNPDGSGQTNLTNNPASDTLHDWLSIPINAYPRPKGATPFLTYLVPAYDACASPNRVHGSPLAFASCNPPTQSSNTLTIGSADSNGKPTKSVSSVRFDTLVGIPSTTTDEADVKITAQVIDVYTQAGLNDYAGELTAKTTLRITDKLNNPHPGGPGAGTVSDIPYGFTIPCAATADTTIGGSCLLSTSADALAPGAVTEGKRSIWALGQVVVYDADGDPFMKQGIFVP